MHFAECLPEVRRALARPADDADRLRVWIEQKDGQKFSPDEVSDGVLVFLALAMHAIDAPRGCFSSSSKSPSARSTRCVFVVRSSISFGAR